MLMQIRLDYPSEYITGISGSYEDQWGYKYLRSISFETNKRTYGPFAAASSSWWDRPWRTIEFIYKVGGKFVGFLVLIGMMALKALGSISSRLQKLVSHEIEIKYCVVKI